MDLPAGTKVGRYRIARLLGRGGMSSVYLSEHRALGSEHALKVLNRPSKTGRRRLVREGKVMAQLRHPHLVPVTDIFELQGHPVLVMDYYPAGTLSERLRRGRLSLDEVDEVALALASALHEAHAKNVIHRDIKPSNILLEPRDGRLHPRLADFGIALAYHDQSGEQLTPAGMSMGTPGYCAPEQFVDAHQVDASADVFALGTVLYEAITGRRAYRIGELIEQAVDISYDKDPRPELLLFRPDAEPRMHIAVEGALALATGDRIPDARTFLDVWRGERSWTLPPKREQGGAEIRRGWAELSTDTLTNAATTEPSGRED